MSFLDRFKNKSPEEKTPQKAPEVKPQTPPARKPEAASQTASAGSKPESKAPPTKVPEASGADPQHEVTLELGDFLSRLPTQVLKAEKLDPTMPVKFDISELADRISRGQTTIPLVEIYRRVPSIFREQILPSDETEVRFPWQKVMKMLSAYKAGPADAPATGLTSAAAESLAEKLRTRRGAVRNIMPGGPSPETSSPAPVAKTPPATSAPPAPAPAPTFKAFEFNLAAPNAEEDERMTKEEILRMRDALRTTLSRAKGEFERQLAYVENQRKAANEEREKALADLARAQQEKDDRGEQVEFEKSVAAKAAENLTKVQQERDALKIDLSNLKAEVAKGSQGDQRMREVIAERDALAQQQANLSRQIAEFQKRGKLGAIMGAEGAAAGAAERSQKEYQRQIEELHRRINILETGQRESAQELGREREAKIKIERQLASADRLQQESAAKVEETQTTLRREHETAMRKRDAEIDRTLNEAREQVEALNAANARLTAELDEARKGRATAHETASTQVQETQAALRRDHEAALVEREALAARALKEVQAQVQALNAANAKLTGELTEANRKLAATHEAAGKAGETPSVPAAADAQATRALAEAQQQIQALNATNVKLAAELEDARKHVAATHQAAAVKVLETHAALRSEHEAAIADREAELRAEIDALNTAKTKLSAELANTRKDLASAQTAGAAKVQETNALLKTEHDAHVALRSRHDALVGEREKLAATLTKREAEFEALKAANAKLTGDLDQARKNFTAAQEAAIAKIRETSSALQNEHEATLAKRNAETERALKDAQAQIDVLLTANTKLTGDLNATRESLAAIQGAAKEWDARASAQFDADTHNYRNRIKALLQERETLSSEREKLSAMLASQAQELAQRTADKEKLRTDSSATIASLREETKKSQAERDTALRERETLIAELGKLRADYQAQREQWERDLAAARQGRELEVKRLTEMRANYEQLTSDKNALIAEMTKARAAHEAAIGGAAAAARAAQEKAVAEVTGERDGLRAKLENATKELTALRASRDELEARHKAATTENARTDTALKELTAQRDDLLAKLESLAADLAAAKQEHGFAFAALDRDRDALRSAKDALAHEFATAKVAHESTLAELRSRYEALNVRASETAQQFSETQRTVEALHAKLEKTEAALAEAQMGETTTKTRLKQQEETTAKLVAEHRAALSALTGKHERAIAATLAEKDAAVAKITAEKATLAAEVDTRISTLNAEHERVLAAHRKEKGEALANLTKEMTATIAAVTADHDKLRDALAYAERKYPAEIAALATARDEAERDAAAVAQRLAVLSVEFDKKHAQLQQEYDSLLADRQKLATELEEARESHKAQGGVFAREFKAVVKQRDDALALLEAERARLAEKMAALDNERAAIAAAEIESKARVERELARFRRERDSVTEQRDTMRERIEKLVVEQRELLEEVTTRAAFTSMKHEARAATPQKQQPPPPAPTPSPAPPAEEPEPEPEPKAREPRPREPRKKEANVIDITEAEIVNPMPEEEGRLKIPRVRPVVIPPPQVRML